MVSLPTSYIILSAITNHYLYILKSENIQRVFACWDIDKRGNDSWPSQWHQLQPALLDTTPVLKVPMPGAESLRYKLKFEYKSFSETTPWLEHPDTCPSDILDIAEKFGAAVSHHLKDNCNEYLLNISHNIKVNLHLLISILILIITFMFLYFAVKYIMFNKTY